MAEDTQLAPKKEPGKRGPPKGNQFWRRRVKHGRPLEFPTPEELWEAAAAYLDWNEANPLIEQVVMNSKDGPVHSTLTKMRAPTVRGLCLFIGIGPDAWGEYRKRKDYKYTCEQIDALIYAHKFEGAAAGLLNHSIIARELGLAEISKHQGDPENPIVTKDVTDAELARRAAFLLRKSRSK